MREAFATPHEADGHLGSQEPALWPAWAGHHTIARGSEARRRAAVKRARDQPVTLTPVWGADLWLSYASMRFSALRPLFQATATRRHAVVTRDPVRLLLKPPREDWLRISERHLAAVPMLSIF